LGELKAAFEKSSLSWAYIIRHPNEIEDTNRFASVLAGIKPRGSIAHLIDAVSSGIPGETQWLADYLYVLLELLEEEQEFYPVDESFVNLLGGWLLHSGGGEISWKAAGVMACLDHDATRDFLMQGALDQSLFNLTRISCLRGTVNRYPQDAPELLSTLEIDENQEVKNTAVSARNYLFSKVETARGDGLRPS
jgi:hypothetical protein